MPPRWPRGLLSQAELEKRADWKYIPLERLLGLFLGRLFGIMLFGRSFFRWLGEVFFGKCFVFCCNHGGFL